MALWLYGWYKWTPGKRGLLLNVSVKEANGAGVEKQNPWKDRREISRALDGESQIMAVKSERWSQRKRGGGDKTMGFFLKLEWEKYQVLVWIREKSNK